MTTITINGQSYGLCTLPARPGAASIEIAMNDATAVVTSPYTRQTQTQAFPGGDWWDATVTLPAMTSECAAAWRGFLGELRGRLNVFQLSDPSAWPARGIAFGAPVVDSSNPANNLPMTWSLTTRGWTEGAQRLLLPGQQFQIGYRLHMVCEVVNADGSGDATLTIWPSLRETPADGTQIVLRQPAGLFRLANDRRAVQWSPGHLTTLDLKCVEAK